jgi:hypothetical protein
MNPTGGVRMGRDIKIMLPRDNHGYCLLVKEPGLLMTGYGLSIFGNRPVRTRMPGGVGGWGRKPPGYPIGKGLRAREATSRSR